VRRREESASSWQRKRRADAIIPGPGKLFRAAITLFGSFVRCTFRPVLKEKRRQPAGQLSGGQQRMIEIGRTLMGEPKVLLVDEPTAGLSKMYAEEVYQMLCDLRDRDNLGILLVDQEIRHALRIADYVYVLELGRNKFDGPPSEFSDLAKAFWVG
jgi:branched-chain amino acid transport system ATP-binding protein